MIFVTQPFRDQLESVDFGVLASWQAKFSRNIFVCLVKSRYGACVYPEDTAAGIFSLKSVAVLDSYLRFPERRIALVSAFTDAIVRERTQHRQYQQVQLVAESLVCGRYLQ